ncbi:MAG: tRNA uridine-5-carboxymethylaminomethyl(34) synthesis GTPase MnmE [Calditrichia bacterium]
MNKITDFSRTIVALATALGSGSIAVIRMSGPDAIVIVNRVFEGKNLEEVPANTINYGRIVDGDREFDQVLVSVFHMPHSYTGENYIEISCHANPFIVNDIIEVLMNHGAKTARAGEYTLRAFLNGKLDLSQAEAVASIIQAKSRFGIKNSLEQLNGKLASRIMQMRQQLIDILGLIEIDLDFSEEEIEIIPKAQIISRLHKIEKDLSELKTSYNFAKLLEGGIHLTIIGEPNAGKSTLLNQLLGENRAITSHIPGTTRDTIHENIVINDVLIKLVDTAGLRKTRDELESEAIKRTKSQASQADIVLLVVDVSSSISDNSLNLVKESVNWIKGQVLLVANKIDKGLNQATLKKLSFLKKPIVNISAINGEGLKELEKSIVEQVSTGFEEYSDDLIITSKRQTEVIEKTTIHLYDARHVLENDGGIEFAAVDLRQALNVLGEITGETVTDDILNNIFANFCIGK